MIATGSSIHSDALRIGMCGFCLPQAELFRRFQLLEIQQTFYWPPQLKTVERWRRTAPSDFEFTLKAFQAITHAYNQRTYRKTRFSASELAQCGGFCDTHVVRDAWELTRSLASALGATIIVFQCPPSFKANEETVRHLQQFFNWAARDRLRFAWEPRHSTWTPALIDELCRELELIHAVDPFEQESIFGVPRYYRLHGTPTGRFRYQYNHPYSENELRELIHLCAGSSTYCLFNNKQMSADAQRLEKLTQPRVAAGGVH